MIDGWFTPTHSCVIKQERLLLREKWKGCASCCRPSSPRIQSEAEAVSRSGTGEEVIQDHSSARQATCLQQHEKELKIALSSPGPQYLRFLEEHSFEILVRYQVEGDKMKLPATSEINDENQNQIVITNEGMIKTPRIKKITSPDFEWKVGTYAVRLFLLRLDSFNSFLSEPRLASHDGQPIHKKQERKRYEFKARCWAGIVKLGRTFRREKKRKLGFREIVDDEKTSSTEGGTRAAPRVKRGNTLIRGLLWYHGISGVLNCPDTEEERLGWVDVTETEAEEVSLSSPLFSQFCLLLAFDITTN